MANLTSDSQKDMGIHHLTVKSQFEKTLQMNFAWRYLK